MEVAEACFENGHYRDAINRSYYAAFYAVKAVWALDFVDFKKHKDVIAYFNKTYIASEVFAKENGRRLANMQQLREKSDYDDFFIADKTKANDQIQSARKIIEDVEYYLKCYKE